MLVAKHNFFSNALAFGFTACLLLTYWSGAIAALGALSMGLAFVGLHYRVVWIVLRRNWLLMLYPVWCGITVAWAVFPQKALKLDILYFATFVICLPIVSIIPIKRTTQFFCVLLSLTLVSVLLSSNTVSIFQTGEVVRIGVLGSKNNLSFIATFSLSAGAILLAQSKNTAFDRLLALITISLSLISILQARSLGTVLSIGVCAGFGVFSYYSRVVTGYRHARLFLIYGLACCALIVAVGLALFFTYDGYIALMAELGKDATITGRTFIWSIGLKSISENFWGGVGLASYWSEFNPDAVTIWIKGSRDIGVPYGFHNLYINTWVETGIVGFLIMSAIVSKALYRSLQTVFRQCSTEQVIAATVGVYFFLKSFFEVPIFTAFSINTFYFFYIWIILNQTNLDQKSRGRRSQ